MIAVEERKATARVPTPHPLFPCLYYDDEGKLAAFIVEAGAVG